MKTIETMCKAQATCLALEAGKTLIFDLDKVVVQANRHGIAIVAVEHS